MRELLAYAGCGGFGDEQLLVMVFGLVLDA